LDQHDDHIVFLLENEIRDPYMQKETHFRRRRRLIAVRLTIYIDHLDAILVSNGYSDGIPEMGWRCSSWLLLHPLRTCSDLNLVDSDLTGGGKLDGAWGVTEAHACRPESKVRRGSAIQTKLVLGAGPWIIRHTHYSRLTETHSGEFSFVI
jgi:hypothetical protein